jgi:hypothetical protein
MTERKMFDVERPWWLLPRGAIHPGWWVAVFAAIVWSDILGGLEHFPLLYTIPVGLAGWYSGRWAALLLAGAVAIFRLAFEAATLTDFVGIGLMTTARGIVVLFIGLWFARLSEVERALDRRVRALERMLPICSFCKSIRNEAGEWERIDTFISRRSDVEFTHSFCPSCGAAHYGSDVTADATG